MPDSRFESRRLLDILIERLYASITRGPAINATPGRSRQRMDLATLETIPDVLASEVLQSLMGESGKWRQRITAEQLRDDIKTDECFVENSIDDQAAAARKKQLRELKAVLRRLSTIADDAYQFQQDTGAYVLFLGYPLLSIPPSSLGLGKSPRVLAPLAFMPISVVTGKGSAPFVELSCAAVGTELVFINEAVKVFLEKQLSKTFPALFEDEEGTDPAREIQGICEAVTAMMEMAQPPDLAGWPVVPVPETADLPAGAAILPSAVIGLFRLENQNMIADLQTLKQMETYPPTVAPFLTLKPDLQDESHGEEIEPESEDIDGSPSRPGLTAREQRHEDEHMVTLADPSQRTAVLMARSAQALVVHGPPGTGKSQTIANIVGDYLARDKRVLIVCEKRTALDVVKNRLDHIGLGHLCAVVHDATRDRTSLFKMIRDRLDVLADTQPGNSPEGQLKIVNGDLENEQGRLRKFLQAIREKGDAGRSFTELTGEWLQAFHKNMDVQNPTEKLSPSGVPPEVAYRNQPAVEGVLRRGRECQYDANPWRGRHGFTLQGFMARSVVELRGTIDALLVPAQTYDNGRHDNAPKLDEEADFAASAARAATLARLAGEMIASANGHAVPLQVLSTAETAATHTALKSMDEAGIKLSEPLDAELRMGYESAPVPLPQITTDLAAVREYLAHGLGLMGWFRFSVRGRAKEAAARYGLALNENSVRKLESFLEGLRSRVLLQGTLAQHVKGVSSAPLMADVELSALWKQCDAITRFFVELDSVAAWKEVAAHCRAVLIDPHAAASIPEMFVAIEQDFLRREELITASGNSKMFSAVGIAGFRKQLAVGEELLPTFSAIGAQLDRLECLVRMEEEARQLPGAFGDSTLAVAAAGYDAEAGWWQLLEPILETEIKRRLEECRDLTAMDATALKTSIARIQDLHKRKRELVAEWINWKWTEKQRVRLLAGTGSRLNSDGADLRRRLALRGKNATRVRQVIQQGANQHTHDDPLFDVCPVWMASPETVAQLFPLDAVFDAVVFDEASQCRLEQGVGVLARGNRVIIAGDTRQLPPTRFFEAAVVSGAEHDLDSDDPDALFTSQQSDIEDLLTAALNIEVDQSFLEVHYRSSRTELIEFSNQAFYGGRLQALPARPSATVREPAVRLHQLNSTYEKRQNEGEADHVVGLVRKWLSQPRPPSIGIVTFNLTQKDLITDKLEETSATDEAFAKLLDVARTRQGEGSFEGLFVKNLESVQGDERDVIILSCTYGPDAKGKFYRRFGPLALSGGERRLNVIVTRARDVVEVVSSIPESEYMTLDSVPDGTKPTGSWHFMNYLRYAKNLGRNAGVELDAMDKMDENALKNQANQTKEPAASSPSDPSGPTNATTIPRSSLVDALSEFLVARHQVQPLMYLGTEGFHVDMAFPVAPGESAISSSIQIDGSRFTKAADPAEWEVYQSGILSSRDWQPQGLWSPQLFRDPTGTAAEIAGKARNDTV